MHLKANCSRNSKKMHILFFKKVLIVLRQGTKYANSCLGVQFDKPLMPDFQVFVKYFKNYLERDSEINVQFYIVCLQ